MIPRLHRRSKPPRSFPPLSPPLRLLLHVIILPATPPAPRQAGSSSSTPEVRLLLAVAATGSRRVLGVGRGGWGLMGLMDEVVAVRGRRRRVDEDEEVQESGEVEGLKEEDWDRRDGGSGVCVGGVAVVVVAVW
ncbi:hypothetical protein VTK26DRAFT_2739 [Humicola hyalothermophila]